MDKNNNNIFRCPACINSIPMITYLSYAINKPRPVILLKCKCSNYPISLDSFDSLYNPTSEYYKEDIRFRSKQDKLSLLINDISILFQSIIDNPEASPSIIDLINTLQSNFTPKFKDIHQLHHHLLFTCISQANNSNHITYSSIIDFKTNLNLITKRLKKPNASNESFILSLIKQLETSEHVFIETDDLIKENNRSFSHLFCSKGNKYILQWKKNFCIKPNHFPLKHKDAIESMCELSNGNIVTASHDKSINIWDRQTQTILRTIKESSIVFNDIQSVLDVIQLDNGLLAAGYGDNLVRLWNISTGECVKVLYGHFEIIIKLRQLSNRELVACSRDTYLSVWDLNNYSHYLLKGHTSSVQSVIELTKENNSITIASCSLDKTIIIWNLDKKAIIKTMTTDTTEPLLNICLLHDGKILAGSAEVMYLWNWRERVLEKTIMNGSFCAIQMRNGNIVTGDNKKTVKVFDYPDMNLIITLNGHKDLVICLIQLSDDSIASCSWDSTFIIWE